jgi:hypothetical protein
VPDSIHQYFDAAPQQGTERLRLWPRPCQQVIEQNDIGGDLLDLIVLGLERALGGRNQEAYYKRSKRGEKSGAEPLRLLHRCSDEVRAGTREVAYLATHLQKRRRMQLMKDQKRSGQYPVLARSIDD